MNSVLLFLVAVFGCAFGVMFVICSVGISDINVISRILLFLIGIAFFLIGRTAGNDLVKNGKN